MSYNTQTTNILSDTSWSSSVISTTLQLLFQRTTHINVLFAVWLICISAAHTCCNNIWQWKCHYYDKLWKQRHIILTRLQHKNFLPNSSSEKRELGRPRTSDFNCCDNRGSNCRSRREAVHLSDSLLAQTLIQLRHGLQGYSIGACFVALNAKRKERKKEVLATSNNESKVT